MSEWRKIWASGLPNESRSPNLGHRMAAKRVQRPWRWDSGMIFTNMSGIWEMSVNVTMPSGTRNTLGPSTAPHAFVYSDISQMTSRFAEIMPPHHRRGNRVFSAANRWPHFSVS